MQLSPTPRTALSLRGPLPVRRTFWDARLETHGFRQSALRAVVLRVGSRVSARLPYGWRVSPKGLAFGIDDVGQFSGAVSSVLCGCGAGGSERIGPTEVDI